MIPAAPAAGGAEAGLRSARLQRGAGTLEPLRNPVNWDNFRKGAVLVLILSAAASVVLFGIYFFVLGG
jgi:hypothetical protein